LEIILSCVNETEVKKRDIPLADLIQNGIVDAPASSIDSFDDFQAIRRQQKTLNI
jgi:hypothetical protein